MCLLCGKSECELTDDTTRLTSADGSLDKSVTTTAAGPDIAANTSTTANMSVGGTFDSDIGSAGDHDWIRINLTAGQWYEFTAVGIGGGALSDSTLALMDASGNQIAFNDDGFSGNYYSRLLHFAETTGTYYLNVGGYSTETGDYRVAANAIAAPSPLDAITWTENDFSWGSPPPTTVNVYFETGAVSVTDPLGETNNTVGFSPTRINLLMTAIEAYESIINVNFVQTTNLANADFVIIQANISALGYWSVGGGNATINGSSYTVDGLGVFDSNGQGWTDTGLAPGGYGYLTFLHEFGHGLGLAHPHDGGGGSDQMAGVTDQYSTGLFDVNQTINTVMSYADGWVTAPHGVSPSNNYGWSGGPMALDIAVLQDRYGANTSTATGNTTYTLPTANAAGTYYTAIWDAGGTDSIVHSGNLAATIDLRPASLAYDELAGGPVSYATGIHGGFTIAAGVVIENATGGNAGDTIIGNSVANVLSGQGGNDSISGGDGNDTLAGGDGNDTLDGGAGADLLFGGPGIDQLFGGDGNDNLYVVGNDSLLEGGSGYDQVIVLDTSGVNIQIGTGVEYVAGNNGNDALNASALTVGLTIGGAGGNDTITGSSGADVLAGNDGNDTVMGGGGADVVFGGTGVDDLYGGDGDDKLYILGNDGVLDGGIGYDRVIVLDTSAVNIQIGSGVEYAAGNAGGDVINASALTTAIEMGGAGGNDTLTGGSGNDTVGGGIGADLIFGGAGADLLLGGDGNDTLNGGTGNDSFVGGNGFDTFVFEAGSGNDFVFQFQNGQDVFDFTGHTQVNSISDVGILDSGADAYITLAGGGQIVVFGAAGQIEQSDFLF